MIILLILSSQYNECDPTRRGTKRVSNNSDTSESSKRKCKTELSKRKGVGMLLEKLDIMVKVVTERSLKDMEINEPRSK